MFSVITLNYIQFLLSQARTRPHLFDLKQGWLNNTKLALNV